MKIDKIMFRNRIVEVGFKTGKYRFGIGTYIHDGTFQVDWKNGKYLTHEIN